MPKVSTLKHLYWLDEPQYRKEAAFLRSNDTIELYDVSDGRFSFITKYEITTAKCLEMKSITIPWSKSYKDALVIYLPQDKVLVPFHYALYS